MENRLSFHLEDKLEQILGSSVKILSGKPLGGGCINNAMKLETSSGAFFLKWNTTCAPNLFTREAESLIELGKASSSYLHIPKVIVSEEVGELPGYIIMEYLEPASYSSQDERNLGRGLATIHQFPADRFGFYNDNYCGSTIQDNSWNTNWVDFFGQQRLLYILQLIQKERNMPSSQMKVYEKLVSRLPGLLPSCSKPALIHGDLWSGNYMHTNKGPALIDPCAYYADCEMEMGIMTMFGGFSGKFWEGYMEVNPLDPGWEKRNKIYQLYHVLNHYYLFGGGYGHQAFNIAQYYAG